MICKHCNNEIPDGSDFCPKCGSPTSPEVTKKGNKMVIGIVVSLMCAVIVGGGVYFGLSKNQSEQQQAPPPQPISEAHEVTVDEQNPSPVEFTGGHLERNHNNTPGLRVDVKNISNKRIDTYRVKIDAYTNDNEKVHQYGQGNTYFRGISQNLIEPDQTDMIEKSWWMEGFEHAHKFEVFLSSVHFTDGTTWRPERTQKISTWVTEDDVEIDDTAN